MSPVTPKDAQTWTEFLAPLATERQIMATARSCAALDPKRRAADTWKRYLSRYRNEGVVPDEEQAQIIAQALRRDRSQLPSQPTRLDRLQSLETTVAAVVDEQEDIRARLARLEAARELTEDVPKTV